MDPFCWFRQEGFHNNKARVTANKDFWCLVGKLAGVTGGKTWHPSNFSKYIRAPLSGRT